MKELFDYDKKFKKSSKLPVIEHKEKNEPLVGDPFPILKSSNSNLAMVLLLLLAAAIALYSWYKNKQQENG